MCHAYLPMTCSWTHHGARVGDASSPCSLLGTLLTVDRDDSAYLDLPVSCTWHVQADLLVLDLPCGL